jgi:endonuclease YncB( thermonuclease family)
MELRLSKLISIYVRTIRATPWLLAKRLPWSGTSAIGMVLVDGRDVNLELVRAGLAWHYKFYEKEQPPGERRLYSEAEEVARLDRVGLWGGPSPIPPWDFRRK